MAIAKNPMRNTSETSEHQAAAFIAKTGKAEPEAAPEGNRKPTMIRIPPALLERIDKGAKRLGISRSAFIVQSAAEKLERMEG
jgi:predicted HicB family RNase H-like nuclease